MQRVSACGGHEPYWVNLGDRGRQTQHARLAWDRLCHVLALHLAAPADVGSQGLAPLKITITNSGSGHNCSSTPVSPTARGSAPVCATPGGAASPNRSHGSFRFRPAGRPCRATHACRSVFRSIPDTPQTDTDKELGMLRTRNAVRVALGTLVLVVGFLAGSVSRASAEDRLGGHFGLVIPL